MDRCPNCGAGLIAGAPYCPTCKTHLTQSYQPPQFESTEQSSTVWWVLGGMAVVCAILAAVVMLQHSGAPARAPQPAEVQSPQIAQVTPPARVIPAPPVQSPILAEPAPVVQPQMQSAPPTYTPPPTYAPPALANTPLTPASQFTTY